MSRNPNKIVKNTFFLYGKMCITIFFTLYTTRLVLKSLGVVDYGIFGDKKQVFNVSMMLHFIIAVCACILLCSFSYLFFDKIINIPIERLYAAKVVYYSMVFSVVITVLSVPYDAVINSHENMLFNSGYNRFFWKANNRGLYYNICIWR